MRYKGEHLQTITYKEAKKLCRDLQLKVPKYRQSVDVGSEGNVIYQLVNTGNGTFDIEGYRP